MSLPDRRPSALSPSHPLVGDQLGDMELVLRAMKSTPGLDGCLVQPGKRLRPTIFLLSNQSARAARPRRRRARGDEIRVATAIELIHEASLVHDDLVDRSATRRGRPTLHAAHGEDRALLLGDLLLLSGVRLLVDSASGRSALRQAREPQWCCRPCIPSPPLIASP
jgi:geranylgeranyl pyrophosphate synthase